MTKTLYSELLNSLELNNNEIGNNMNKILSLMIGDDTTSTEKANMIRSCGDKASEAMMQVTDALRNACILMILSQKTIDECDVNWINNNEKAMFAMLIEVVTNLAKAVDVDKLKDAEDLLIKMIDERLSSSNIKTTNSKESIKEDYASPIDFN